RFRQALPRDGYPRPPGFRHVRTIAPRSIDPCPSATAQGADIRRSIPRASPTCFVIDEPTRGSDWRRRPPAPRLRRRLPPLLTKEEPNQSNATPSFSLENLAQPYQGPRA